MKASDLYASPYLKGTDIDKPRRMTIAEVSVETFDDQKTGKESRKAVLSFAGAKKQLILNKSNASALIAAYGDEMADWPGKAVILAQGVAPNGQPTVTVSPLPEDGHGEDGNPF